MGNVINIFLSDPNNQKSIVNLFSNLLSIYLKENNKKETPIEVQSEQSDTNTTI